jgi:hypothetical protein
MFWKLDARCFLRSPVTYMTSDNTQRRAVGDRLTKHNLADVYYLLVLISVDSLWNDEYGSDLAIFPTLITFPSSTLLPAVLLIKLIISWCIFKFKLLALMIFSAQSRSSLLSGVLFWKHRLRILL